MKKRPTDLRARIRKAHSKKKGRVPGLCKEGGRLGFLKGQFSVPDDFNIMGSAEIERMFGGSDEH